MTSLLIWGLVTSAVLAARGPDGRRPARRRPGGGSPTASQARPGAPLVEPHGFGSRQFALRRRGARSDGRVDLAGLVIEVASQLRAGADPGRAWGRALGRPVGGEGAPDRAQLEALAGTGQRSQAVAVVAAGKLAGALGAPLAQVLERVAGGLATTAEADGERRAALAGPRATARVLTGLPVLGVGLGAAVGADPVAVLLDGGVGTAALAVGITLVLLGRWWIGRLVHAAARAGQGP